MNEPRPTEQQIPKNHGRRLITAGALVLALLAGGYMIYGFIAPAQNPDAEPVLDENQELPLPDSPDRDPDAALE